MGDNGVVMEKNWADLKGEGRRLGGLFVVGPDSNVVFEYQESVFGDHANLDDVVKAVKTMQEATASS